MRRSGLITSPRTSGGASSTKRRVSVESTAAGTSPDAGAGSPGAATRNARSGTAKLLAKRLLAKIGMPEALLIFGRRGAHRWRAAMVRRSRYERVNGLAGAHGFS